MNSKPHPMEEGKGAVLAVKASLRKGPLVAHRMGTGRRRERAPPCPPVRSQAGAGRHPHYLAFTTCSYGGGGVLQ